MMVFLREIVEREDIPPRDVLLADSGYDCKSNEKIAIFKPIRRGSCYKSLERIDLYLRWLFYRIALLKSKFPLGFSLIFFRR